MRYICEVDEDRKRARWGFHGSSIPARPERSGLCGVITIDDERIKSHLDRVVRGSVE
jgi:hypothetical protein